MFPLFPKNRKSIPKFLSGKNLTLPILNFYLSNLTNKSFSHMV